MRALVYLRQSLDRDGTGAAVERQRQDCRKLCKTRGWTVTAEFVDNDTSASSTKPRPAYAQMLKVVESGNADVIVAWHADRLTRKLADLEHLIEVSQKTGVKVATVTGDLDLTTDQGRLIGRILASVARGEVERKGARQSRAQQQAADEGRPHGGRRSFGYNADSTINQPEARRLRKAYRDVLAGASVRSVMFDWNDRGVATSMGNRWSRSVVRGLLLNPRNAGLRTYRGEVVGPGKWTPIVDVDTFEAVKAVLEQPERRTTPTTARRYLLPGLALCGVCSEPMPMKTGRTQHGVRTYICGGYSVGLPKHLSRGAEPIDRLVELQVIDRLQQPDAARLLEESEPEVDLDGERVKITAARESLDTLATLLTEGTLDLAGVRRESERLRAQIAESEAVLHNPARAEVLKPLVDADDVAKAWGHLDLDRKRAVIDLLMTVVILPVGQGNHREFDPHTVRIDWRDA